MVDHFIYMDDIYKESSFKEGHKHHERTKQESVIWQIPRNNFPSRDVGMLQPASAGITLARALNARLIFWSPGSREILGPSTPNLFHREYRTRGRSKAITVSQWQILNKLPHSPKIKVEAIEVVRSGGLAVVLDQHGISHGQKYISCTCTHLPTFCN